MEVVPPLPSMPEIQISQTMRNEIGLVMKANGSGLRRCPECGMPSTSGKGRYFRQLQDLPVQGIAVRLGVRINRWRCRNRQCAQKSFVEQLGKSALPYARRTHRVSELARLLGHATGGRSAERLLRRFSIPHSDDTVLRILKREAARRRKPVVRVTGIDDWAWQKGRSYGTIVVDLERREVVDVLPDRSAQSTAQWFLEHPEVEIVSRDRCGLYAQGARRGAPQAEQVADRFHLLQNLRETIEQQLSRNYGYAKVSSTAIGWIGSEATADSNSHGRQPELAKHRGLARLGCQAVWLERFDGVKALQREGKSVGAISKEMSLNWRTVAKWASLNELPERRSMNPKSTTPRKYEGYLSQRWAEGFRTARHLLPEIQKLGYTGSLTHLERLLSQWRRAESTPSLPELSTNAGGHVPLQPFLVPPKAASFLCMKPRGLFTEEEAEKVKQLKDSDPAFATMRQLAMRFRGILHGRNSAKLDAWLDDAHRSGLYGLRRFAIRYGMIWPPSRMPSVSIGAMGKPRVKSIDSKL